MLYIALVIWFLKWAHTPLNSQGLPRIGSNLLSHDPPQLQSLRGQGEVQGEILDFLCLDICCSPDYLVSKMISFVPQVRTVAEI